LGRCTSDDSSPIVTPTAKEPAKLTVNSNTMLRRVPIESSLDVVVLSALYV
jgi:hypothetical protein